MESVQTDGTAIMCGGMDPRRVEIHPDLGHPRQRREARRPRSAQPKPAPLLISEILTAWEIARPDDLIEAFGEHHGLLGAMLEATIKPNWPEDFRRIIDITYRFFSGWRRVHNPITGHDVANDLTTTEFAIAMLAARGWTTQEIAQHLNISANTAKRHISEAMKKLKVKNRKDLKQYMLR